MLDVAAEGVDHDRGEMVGVLYGVPPLTTKRRHRLLLQVRSRSVADYRQHGLIHLLSHAQLPHPGSVEDQPK
jgi:hypothetical protein